jgi:hypothetical protein
MDYIESNENASATTTTTTSPSRYLFAPKILNRQQNSLINKYSLPSTPSILFINDDNTITDYDYDDADDENTTMFTRSIDTINLNNKKLSIFKFNSKNMNNNNNSKLFINNNRLFDEFKKVENHFWKNKHIYRTSLLKESNIFLSIISSSNNLKFIYDYFNMIQYQKCCVLLQSHYEFDKNIKLNEINLNNYRKLNRKFKSSSF